MKQIRRAILFALFCCSTFIPVLRAQQGQQSTPNGTSLQEGDPVVEIVTKESLRNANGGGVFRIPPGRYIKTIGTKSIVEEKAITPETYYIVLDDGSLYSYTNLKSDVFRSLASVGIYFEYRGQIDLAPDSLRKFIGDDLYTFAFSNVYVSRGTDALNWDIDTAGLSGAFPADLALDTAQSVYLATSEGLFKQTHTGSTWQPLSAMTKALASDFVDRTGQWLYVSTQSNGIYSSSDFGSTWQLDSTGIGTSPITFFSDDALGNIYATIPPTSGPSSNAGSHLYRSTEGATTWTRIDGGLRAMSATGAITINSVWGDSALSVATDLGLYTSTDQGNTWSDANAGIQAQDVYGFLKLPSGRLIATTDLGVFTLDAGSSSWTHRLPASANQRFDMGPSAIQRDASGNLYTGNPDNFYKSTDNGTTWALYGPASDFSGGLPVVPGLFFVDENSLLHYAPPFVYSTAVSSQLYVQSGSNWVGDQTGLNFSLFDQFFGYASNRQGTLFVFRSSASNVQVARRPVGGGTWVPDTAGLGGKALMSMVRGRDGTMYGGAKGGGLYHRVDSSWSKITTPAPISTSDVAQLSVDSTGAIFVGLQVPGSYPVLGYGVYFSKNGGSTWTYAGLDSVALRGLVSSGDSTFALTVGRGVSLLRSISFAFLQSNAPLFPFDTVNVGLSKDIQIAITNTGTDTLKVSGVTSSNSAFTPQQTTATINPQQSSGITVRFTPSNTGAFSGSIKIVSNSSHSPDSVYVTGIASQTTSVRSSASLARVYALDQNYPNPFNPTTTISFELAATGKVSLKVYDLLGREIETLVHESLNAGQYTVKFDASKYASGVYFYRLEAGNFVQTRKLMLLK